MLILFVPMEALANIKLELSPNKMELDSDVAASMTEKIRHVLLFGVFAWRPNWMFRQISFWDGERFRSLPVFVGCVFWSLKFWGLSSWGKRGGLWVYQWLVSGFNLGASVMRPKGQRGRDGSGRCFLA